MNINNIFNVAKVISNPIFKIKNGKPTTFFEAIIKSVDGSYCRINVISYYKLAKRCSYINKGDYVYLTDISGTTVNDRVGSNNGTLINSPTFIDISCPPV